MGTELLSFYKTKVKKSWKIAFLSAFIGCLLVHIYKFTNTLPNHDTYFNIYSTQNIIGSGRWFLQYACGISSYFDLPWLNGLLCAVYLGLTTAVVVELFRINNPVVILLTGAILVGSPCTTETLFFGYTADGYLLGLFLSAVSALLMCRGKKLWHYLCSGLCLCLSVAIYQSYVSFTIVLCIFYLLNLMLEGKITTKDTWKQIGKYVLTCAISLLSYYLLWKLLLVITEKTATPYQGIDNVGQITVSTLINGAVQSVRNLVLFFIEWNVLKDPASPYAILNIAFLLVFAVVFAFSVIKSGAIRKLGRLATIVLCLVVCVPAISIWYFSSDDVFYRPMMMHGTCVIYIAALIFFDRWCGKRVSTVLGLLVAVIAFNFGVMANIAYFTLDKCYEKTYYVGSQLMEDIDSACCEDSNISSIAFIGDRGDEVYLGTDSLLQHTPIFLGHFEADLCADHIHTYLVLKHTFGLDIPEATEETIKELESTEKVLNMNTWPSSDAIEVIDSILVIKLGDIG